MLADTLFGLTNDAYDDQRQETDRLIDRLSEVLLHHLSRQARVQAKYSSELHLDAYLETPAKMTSLLDTYLLDDEADRLGPIEEWLALNDDLLTMGVTAYRIFVIQAIKTTLTRLDEIEAEMRENDMEASPICGLNYAYLDPTYPYRGFTVTIQRTLSI